jgi:hypothetical protein
MRYNQNTLAAVTPQRDLFPHHTPPRFTTPGAHLMSTKAPPTRSAADAVVEPVFHKEQRQNLEKYTRFLQNMGTGKVAARALAHGYNDAEHEQGWALLLRASGSQRPISHFVSQSDQAALLSSDSQRALIRDLDAFENKWFPITEAVLARYIQGDTKDTFLAAFFQDLQQQPEGPAVVGSVETLLNRVESLSADSTPGAQAAAAALSSRGLSPEAIDKARDLITQSRAFAPAQPIADADQIAQATADQRAALQELSLWYNDWATTFRRVLDYHSLLRLGLISIKRDNNPAPTPTP